MGVCDGERLLFNSVLLCVAEVLPSDVQPKQVQKLVDHWPLHFDHCRHDCRLCNNYVHGHSPHSLQSRDFWRRPALQGFDYVAKDPLLVHSHHSAF